MELRRTQSGAVDGSHEGDLPPLTARPHIEVPLALHYSPEIPASAGATKQGKE